MSKPTLNLLFHAHHFDGSIVVQTPEDISLTGGGSAFSDVDVDNVENFRLYDLKGEFVAMVDLVSGLFRIRDHVFSVADQNFIKTNPLKLIYFRETRVERDVVVDKVNNTQTVVEDRHFVNRYFIGWETTDARGKKVKHIVGIYG